MRFLAPQLMAMAAALCVAAASAPLAGAHYAPLAASMSLLDAEDMQAAAYTAPPTDGMPTSPAPTSTTGECADDPPEYYAIDLVPTRNLPGLGRAGGKGYVTYDASPFGISVTESGHYLYDVTVSAEHLPRRDDGRYVAWITTPDLDRIERAGALDDNLQVSTTVTFNKFLVVVTFERLDAGAPQASSSGIAGASPPAPSGQAASITSTAGAWHGPIILRGMSRSGLMHTMAGHGPYDSEPCAKYGY